LAPQVVSGTVEDKGCVSRAASLFSSMTEEVGYAASTAQLLASPQRVGVRTGEERSVASSALLLTSIMGSWIAWIEKQATSMALSGRGPVGELVGLSAWL